MRDHRRHVQILGQPLCDLEPCQTVSKARVESHPQRLTGPGEARGPVSGRDPRGRRSRRSGGQGDDTDRRLEPGERPRATGRGSGLRPAEGRAGEEGQTPTGGASDAGLAPSVRPKAEGAGTQPPSPESPVSVQTSTQRGVPVKHEHRPRSPEPARRQREAEPRQGLHEARAKGYAGCPPCGTPGRGRRR